MITQKPFSPDLLETEEGRSSFFWYVAGALPGTIAGAVAGFYGADTLNDSYELLREAPMVVRGTIDALGLILGGTAGDIIGGFSALGIRSIVRRLKND